MFEDYNEGGRWVTINGKHVFIDTSKYMNSFIKGKGYDNMMKKKGDDRFEELKQMYPNAEFYELSNGVQELAVNDQELIDEFAYDYENDRMGKERGYYKDTTQKILNEMPVSLNMRWRDDWSYQDRQSHYIYRNKSDLMKGIKNFGGLDEITDHGRINYSITSQSGIGEYYLVRDRFAKGGWKWEDVNGDEVKGVETKDFGKINRKRSYFLNKELFEKYGEKEFRERFGEYSYKEYLEGKEKYEK